MGLRLVVQRTRGDFSLIVLVFLFVHGPRLSCSFETVFAYFIGLWARALFSHISFVLLVIKPLFFVKRAR